MSIRTQLLDAIQKASDTGIRELPVERREQLIRRAMRWPDPLAEQVARVVRR
jgi:hypothetical protein